LPGGIGGLSCSCMTSHAYSRALRLAAPFCLLALAACQPTAQNVPGETNDQRPWDGIAENQVVHFVGTEPFWSGEATATKLTYSTPENQKGEVIDVTRFAGRGGVSYSGTLAAGAMMLAVTPGKCSDGMSDREFPFIATLQIGSQVRKGCAWTERQPFIGPERP
jgi:uncharacterized membrane protein